MKKQKKASNPNAELHKAFGIPAYKTVKHEESEPYSVEKKEKRMKAEPEYKNRKK